MELGYFVRRYYLLLAKEQNDCKSYLGTKFMKKFEKICCEGYNLLRRHCHKLINIFLTMLQAGIPELKGNHGIKFLKKRLPLE